MPRRRTILPSAMFTLVAIAALSSQATRTTLAADECLAKPTGPTPQGQHWYYRIDHANNNRQCWRLAAEGLPVQKTAPQSEESTASEPDPPQQPRAAQTVPAAPAQPPANVAPAPAANSFAAMPPAPWPAPPTLPVMPQAQPELQTANADDSAAVVTNDQTPFAKEDTAPRPVAEKPLPSAAPPQQFAGVERTFVLLMVMFALLAVTGPILHFTHRQRAREVINYKPPQWAPVVALNAPEPRIRHSQVPEPPARIERRPAPRPVRAAELPPAWRPAPAPTPPLAPIEPNERLTRALQQLIDRMETMQTARSGSPPGRTRRADVEMLKNAR